MLTLYDYYRSSACFRVRIALNLKNIDYDTVRIHLVNNGGEQNSPEYLAINPQGLVPTLKDDTKIMTQSIAIIEYLNEIYPTPPLLPSDPYKKALVRAFALSIAADIHPLNNSRVLKYLIQEMKLTEEKKQTWYFHWLAKGLSALEKQLSNSAETLYCFGNEPTLADVCLVPQLFNARRFSFDLTDYPTLVRIDANCQKLPAFINAWPAETTV